MSESPETSNEFKVLGAFASVIGLLSIALYFTGWIYRWAYFGSFQLELTKLNFPAESFFFAPIQVFLGSIQALSHAVLGIIVAIILIKFNLWLLQPVKTPEIVTASRFQAQIHRFSQGLHRFWITRKLRSVAAIFPIPLLKDLVIVAWLLMALFWVARWQGVVNAQKDMRNDLSSLPVVALLQPEKEFGLGRNLENLFIDPSLQKTRLIGDVGLFEQLQKIDTRVPGDSSESGDWRLLVSSNGWLYLFRTLPQNLVSEKRRPLVLAVREGGEQMMILSPTASEQ
jgi:hypothetical protein